MESILSIVLLIVIYSVISIVKTLSGKGDVNANPADGEVFPEVEFLEPEEPVTPAPVRSGAPERERPRRRAHGGNHSPVPTGDGHVAADVRESGDEEQKDKRFSFKGKSDAKRAVIYSEILNRKYD